MIVQWKAVRSALVALLTAALLGACASTPKLGGDPNLQVMRAEAMPPPDRMDLTNSGRSYYVGPFDRLTIDVFGVPELAKREVQVDAAGKISFPLAGTLQVAGLTPREIEELLTLELKTNYIRDPQVTVNLTETVSQVVTVDGQVAKPGLFPVIGKLSLMRVMALAGGTTEFSKLNDVVIYRTVQGQRYAALYDLNQIRHGVYADPEVFANDVVMVGDSKSRRLFKDVLQALPALATPLFFAIDRATN
jgi:polysaccharide export outer membrane protein